MADSLLHKKRVLLEQLKQLTAKQVQMLDRAQYEHVIPLFDEKERIIAEIDQIDLQLGDGVRKNDSIMDLLHEIRHLNAQLEAGLEKAKKFIAARLVELQQNKKSDSLYQPRSVQVEGAFIDKKK